MSNFYLDIDGPTHMDEYLQVKHEDTADDGPVLGVARVLDKEDSKIEAEKIVKRYNAYEELIAFVSELWDRDTDIPDDLFFKADELLQKYNETTVGEPTT